MPGLTPLEAVKCVKKENLPTNKITISSDGFGSYSSYDSDGNLLKIGIASVKSLYEEFVNFVKDGFSIEEALPYFTTNVARSVALQNKKGEIKENYDADILLIDEKFDIKFVVAKGEILKDDSGFIKKGTYE